MKKTFEITHPKIKPERVIDSIKHDVKKYIKRERNKTLPVDADYWDFDCKFGDTAEVAQEIHLSAISKAIDAAVIKGLSSFYIEIMARAANRQIADTGTEEYDEE